MYNEKYLINNQMWQYRNPKGPAIHTYFASDGTAIGMFQGTRGSRPDLDFRVKILLPNPDASPFLLPHDEWVVDLLLKAQHNKDKVIELLEYYLHFYDKCTPFASVADRANYTPITKSYVEENFAGVSAPGTMSIGGLAIILELFCLCEKQNDGAHQFRQALEWTKECVQGKRDYKNLLNLVIRHREY